MTMAGKAPAHEAQAGETIARRAMPTAPLKVYASQRCPHHGTNHVEHLAYEVKTATGGRTWLCAFEAQAYEPI